jgi:hypothetical protein
MDQIQPRQVVYFDLKPILQKSLKILEQELGGILQDQSFHLFLEV